MMKMNNWSNDRFEYADKKLNELLKKQNSTFENSKFKFKKIANQILGDVKKIGYKGVQFNQSDFSSESNDLYFKDLYKLLLAYLIDVANNSYEYAFDEINNLSPQLTKKKKIKKITEREVNKWNKQFIENLNYSFWDDLWLQSLYLAYRLSNALNENIVNNVNVNAKEEKPIKKEQITNMNSRTILMVYIIQKKKYSNTLSNMFTHVVVQSQLKAYNDLGVNKVMRVAENDLKTCKLCKELDGTVYILGEQPEVMVHPYCRCYYEAFTERKV